MSKWKMVPVEPTDEMIRAIDGLICSSYLWPVYAYRAMIDAAPVQQTDPLGYFTFNKEWNVWEQMSAKYKNASDATPLYLHPPSAELARLRAENERLKADAATLAWIRAEHDRFDPLVKCVIKAGRDRHGGQWAEFIDGENFAAIVDLYARTDAEIAARKAAKAKPEATVSPPLPPV